MRRWFVLLFILGMAVMPFSAQAQSVIKFSTLQVQLWPEYDQPSMLVICEFKLADGVIFPTNVSFLIPKGGNLVAVASLSNSQLVNVEYSGPTEVGDWDEIKVNAQTATTYHIEYYAPISKTGTERQFNYVWQGNYPIEDFSVSVWPPTDITALTTDPALSSVTNTDGTTSWKKDFGAMPANQQFTLKINYNKTSDKLSVPQPSVQPSQPLNSDTAGSAMSTFKNSLPYIIGGIGLLLIGGGTFYFWQSGRRKNKARKRHTVRMEEEGNSEVYCHQCGTRAHKGDRFCRVCGTKLRQEA